MNKEILEAMERMTKAIATSEDKYIEYFKSVQDARKATEELREVIDAYLNKPHISIEDFEIDN